MRMLTYYLPDHPSGGLTLLGMFYVQSDAHPSIYQITNEEAGAVTTDLAPSKDADMCLVSSV